MSEYNDNNQYNQQYYQQEQNEFNGGQRENILNSHKNLFSYISFVAGLNSLMTMGNCLYFILAVVAGAIAIDKKEPEKRLAVAGMVSSILSYVILIIYTLLKLLLVYFLKNADATQML